MMRKGKDRLIERLVVPILFALSALMVWLLIDAVAAGEVFVRRTNWRITSADQPIMYWVCVLGMAVGAGLLALVALASLRGRKG